MLALNLVDVIPQWHHLMCEIIWLSFLLKLQDNEFYILGKVKPLLASIIPRFSIANFIFIV